MKSKQPVKAKKQKKLVSKKKNEMLTKNNGLALFVKGIEKRVKWIGLFVEHTQFGYIKKVVLMKSIFQ